MNRTRAREAAVRLCYQLSSSDCTADEVLENFFDRDYYDTLKEEDTLYSSFPEGEQKKYIETVIRGIGEHSAELDGYLQKYSRDWEFGRISRTAVAVMKTAMYEALYMPDISVGVAISEAVRIAKHYDEPETVAFINGVLGSFAKGELPEENSEG